MGDGGCGEDGGRMRAWLAYFWTYQGWDERQPAGASRWALEGLCHLACGVLRMN